MVPGISSNDLLPNGVLPEEVILPPAFDKNILGKASKRQAALCMLFTKQHFHLIQSSYFGAYGPRTASVFYDEMAEQLPKTEINKEASRDLSPVMKNAYQTLYTNFENM